MELSGDEKRIQALFSELLLEDQSLMPRFEMLWVRAEATTRVSPLGIMRPVTAIITVIVLAGIGLMAASSWYRSFQARDQANIPAQTIPTTSVPRVAEHQEFAERKTYRQRRLVPTRQTERVTTEESTTLTNWQSPTSVFLQSPTALALSSLPQLNQSARDLEMFLTKNNETMKESK